MLFETDAVGFYLSNMVTFEDGNVQAVLAFYTWKDGLIEYLPYETGAFDLPK